MELGQAKIVCLLTNDIAPSQREAGEKFQFKMAVTAESVEGSVHDCFRRLLQLPDSQQSLTTVPMGKGGTVGWKLSHEGKKRDTLYNDAICLNIVTILVIRECFCLSLHSENFTELTALSKEQFIRGLCLLPPTPKQQRG